MDQWHEGGGVDVSGAAAGAVAAWDRDGGGGQGGGQVVLVRLQRTLRVARGREGVSHLPRDACVTQRDRRVKGAGCRSGWRTSTQFPCPFLMLMLGPKGSRLTSRKRYCLDRTPPPLCVHCASPRGGGGGRILGWTQLVPKTGKKAKLWWVEFFSQNFE